MDQLNPSPVGEQAIEGAVNGKPATSPSPATQDGGVTPGVTTPPAQPNEDQKAIRELQQKYEQDIARLKSTYDKRDAETKKLIARREEEYNKKLRDLELRGLDEPARKQYEEAHKAEEYQRVMAENAQLQQQLQERETIQNYQKFFLENGVSASDLVLDEGAEALAASGWQALTRIHQQTKAELESLKQGTKPPEKELPKAPETLNHNDKTAPLATLQDAIKKYANGDEDLFYRKLEAGSIPSSVLNLKKE